MKICVTGGAGFIGSNLVDRLLAAGHDVVVLDDLSTGSRANLADVLADVDFVEGDLRDRAVVDRVVDGCEVVYHQAALASVARSVESPEEVTGVNVGGTLNVLLAARDLGVRRVVFASSSSVYGDTPTLPKIETMAVTPRSPYAASKAAGEAYLSAFQGAYGLETVALRYFNVYGPRQSPRSQYAAVIPAFVDAMLKGHAPTIFGDGEQTRDFTFVGDVVEANLLAAIAENPPGTPMNIGCGGRVSINELARAIAGVVGFESEPEHAAARAGDVRDSMADIERARAFLGWDPRTELSDGIRVTVDAFRSGLSLR